MGSKSRIFKGIWSHGGFPYFYIYQCIPSHLPIHFSPQPLPCRDIPQQPLILPPSTTRHFPIAWDWGEMNAAKANTDVTQHVVLLERWQGFWGVGGGDARGLGPHTHPNNGHSMVLHHVWKLNCIYVCKYVWCITLISLHALGIALHVIDVSSPNDLTSQLWSTIYATVDGM